MKLSKKKKKTASSSLKNWAKFWSITTLRHWFSAEFENIWTWVLIFCGGSLLHKKHWGWGTKNINKYSVRVQEFFIKNNRHYFIMFYSFTSKKLSRQWRMKKRVKCMFNICINPRRKVQCGWNGVMHTTLWSSIPFEWDQNKHDLLKTQRYNAKMIYKLKTWFQETCLQFGNTELHVQRVVVSLTI